METPSFILGIVGTLTGTAGTAISLFNYFRDRPVVKVHLKWDMFVSENRLYDSTKLWGLARVTNVGRRPVYLAAVALEVPDIELPNGHPLLVHGKPPSYLILSPLINTQSSKLSEGDPPSAYAISQDQMKPYAAHWQHIRAYVEDSTGRKYRSGSVKEQPSWAKS
jgi:hypothetical protein